MPNQWRKRIPWVTLCIAIGSWISPGYSQPQFGGRPRFFEEGYQQLEERIQQLERSQAEPEPLLAIDPNELQWQELISQTAGFRLLIPIGLASDSVRSLSLPSEDLEFDLYSSNQTQFRFVVAFSNPLQDPIEDPQILFEQLQDQIIADSEFEVTDSDSMTWQGFPGYRMELTDEDERIELRLILVEDRIYALGVGQQAEVDLGDAPEQFFDSFQLLL